jgi:malonate-semialdehyde dehydrogenase (acetylating)/methylmalonate-semialdehyde dehydrogenase
MVVMPDADLDQRGRRADRRRLRLGRRALHGDLGGRAVGDCADELMPKLVERAKKLKVGAGDTANVDMGPLVTGIHRDKVAGYIDAGVKEGATLVLDGRENLPGELARASSSTRRCSTTSRRR